MKNNLLSEIVNRPRGMTTAAWEDIIKGLDLFEAASRNIAKAGKLFAGVSEPQWVKFMESSPSGFRATMERVREVGKGLIIPQLATASGSYVGKLRSFSLEDQERFLSEPVEVAVIHNGIEDTRMERVPEMEPATIKQVFNHKGKIQGRASWEIRTIEEQRQWLDYQAKKTMKNTKTTEVKRPGRWTVRDGRAFLAAPKIKAGLTLADLEALREDLGAS